MSSDEAGDASENSRDDDLRLGKASPSIADGRCAAPEGGSVSATLTSPAGPTYINNSYGAGDGFDRRMNAMAYLGIFVGSIALIGICGLLLLQYKAALTPYKNLRSYVNTEIASNPVREIGELIVDDYQLYAQSVCVEGADAETVRRGLRSNLKVPDEVKEEIIRSAVVEKVSCTNSMQNTTASIANDGKAFSYMAYWSTVYVGESTLLASKYSSCVMTAGIGLLVGEQLSGFETRKDPVVVGSGPCKCGFMWCEQCPIFKERETKTPIFKRNKLTLHGQINLHKFMEASAFKSALALVGSGQGLTEMLFGRKSTSSPLVESWKGPSNHVFLGTPPPNTKTETGEMMNEDL